jgi:hypothetical protein
MKERSEFKQHYSMGILWCIGWLFSIGFFHLSFWKGVLAVFIWPYYIGAMVSKFIH